MNNNDVRKMMSSLHKFLNIGREISQQTQQKTKKTFWRANVEFR